MNFLNSIKIVCCVLILSILVVTDASLFFVADRTSKVPIVHTMLGTVVGRYEKSYNGRVFSTFEGIPYAMPPVGELRFQVAQPAVPWGGPLVANTTYSCAQLLITDNTADVLGTEDCLYIYIYVPEQDITGRENMSVIASVHGGGFMFGIPTFKPSYIMDKDLVFVTFNYRLGALGFLSTQDRTVPGNNGLKDQVLALKWIKDNIKYFGGNPNSVTLTGLSAGSTAVHYHYLSPLSKGLFHRGWSQSGVALNSWSITLNPLKNAMRLASYLNCSQHSTLALVQCIQRKPLQELMNAYHNFFVYHNVYPATPFGAVVEEGKGSFLLDHPYKLLQEGKFHQYTWVSSNTAHEGTTPLNEMSFEFLQQVEKHWKVAFPIVFNYNDTTDEEGREVITMKLMECYLHNKSLTGDGLEQFIDLFSDRWYLVEGELALRLHACFSKSQVYYYIFDYILDGRNVTRLQRIGAGHTDDAELVYQEVDSGIRLSNSDKQMKDYFIQFLYDYATTGVPTFNNVTWLAVNCSKLINYLHLAGPDDIAMKSIDELAPTAFWDSLPLQENQHLYRNL